MCYHLLCSLQVSLMGRRHISKSNIQIHFVTGVKLNDCTCRRKRLIARSSFLYLLVMGYGMSSLTRFASPFILFIITIQLSILMPNCKVYQMFNVFFRKLLLWPNQFRTQKRRLRGWCKKHIKEVALITLLASSSVSWQIREAPLFQLLGKNIYPSFAFWFRLVRPKVSTELQ